MLSLMDANGILSEGYRSELIKTFPFGNYLHKVWKNDEGYTEHGPAVLNAMNHLLSETPERMLKGHATPKQKRRLEQARGKILTLVFHEWPREEVHALFRMAALYHDIGKYIIKDRHPSVGWHIVEYLDPREKQALKDTLGDDRYFQLLSIIIRDHDQFGVICTGEASYPILLGAARSVGNVVEERKRVLSALMLFNLADMAGVFPVDGDTVDKVVDDWEWVITVVEHCGKEQVRLDETLLVEASRETYTCQRIQRLLAEASRNWPERRKELNSADFIRKRLYAVFGNGAAIQQFSSQFTRICKLDYGKRFFEALVEYCEGEPKSSADERSRRLPQWAKDRLSSDRVAYAVIAILKRITTDYAGMAERRGGASNLMGVEMKDLTPTGAPEKTARIIDLVVESHYPGLTWMMSDVPVWHF